MSAIKKLLFTNSIDTGLLIFRILLGGFMMIHGYNKFAGGEQVLTGVGSMLGAFGITSGFYALGVMAALSEFGGGLLVVLGLFTRLGSAAVVGTLAVATIIIAGMGKGFSGYSYPLEMASAFLALFVSGPGTYSVDAKINK